MTGGAVFDISKARATKIRKAAKDGQDNLVIICNLDIKGKRIEVRNPFGWNSDM